MLLSHGLLQLWVLVPMIKIFVFERECNQNPWGLVEWIRHGFAFHSLYDCVFETVTSFFGMK